MSSTSGAPLKIFYEMEILYIVIILILILKIR